MAVIDATDLVFGRLASIAAERALKGEKIDIVNAEKCVIIGNKKTIMARVQRKLNMRGKNNPEKGPKHSRSPEKMLKSAVKGMLPAEKERGRQALKRVKAFVGVPERLSGEKAETLEIAAYNGKERASRLGDISRSLGWKWSM